MKTTVPTYLTWTTREGVVINVKDMTDAHLVNAIKMLERKQEHDHKHANDHKHDRITIASASDCLPELDIKWFQDHRYKGLVNVAKARGLAV